jgi:KipI family sensor histidine kinase inhibitor
MSRIISPFGDRALRFSLPLALEPSGRRRLLAGLRAIDGVDDVVLTETVGAVVLANGASGDAVRASLAETLESSSESNTDVATEVVAPALHTIRVMYDGPDLAAVASALGLTPEAVIALHSAPDYEVAMLGFMPGFAYLRGLDPRLVLPRRAEPRPRVPACSVAIAAHYTGIYPYASPGGWNLLGEAEAPNLLCKHAARFAIGDRVRFEPTARPEHVLVQTNTSRSSAVAPRGAYLDVRKAQGLSLVIDAGRVGHMHEAVPHGGAMVPEALARANVAVGNEAGAAGVEIYGAFSVAARGGRITVADDEGGRRQLADGETFAVATEGRSRVRYLAVRGGLDVLPVLGARATMLGARMGGLDGRALRRGDLLPVTKGGPAADASAAAELPTADDMAGDIEIILGPDVDERVSAAMLAATFTISAASDRVGTRLEGPPLPAHTLHADGDRASMPMVTGAVEVTPTGLVVLGPDHPTTGGYPVIAAVAASSLARLFARPIGAPVRLVARALPST